MAIDARDKDQRVQGVQWTPLLFTAVLTQIAIIGVMDPSTSGVKFVWALLSPWYVIAYLVVRTIMRRRGRIAGSESSAS